MRALLLLLFLPLACSTVEIDGKVSPEELELLQKASSVLSVGYAATEAGVRTAMQEEGREIAEPRKDRIEASLQAGRVHVDAFREWVYRDPPPTELKDEGLYALEALSRILRTLRVQVDDDMRSYLDKAQIALDLLLSQVST